MGVSGSLRDLPDSTQGPNIFMTSDILTASSASPISHCHRQGLHLHGRRVSDSSDHRHPRPSYWSPFKFRAIIRAEQIGGTGLTHKRGSSQLESQAQSVSESWPANPRSLAVPGPEQVAPAICLAPGRSRGFLRRSLHESDRYISGATSTLGLCAALATRHHTRKRRRIRPTRKY
jgi:hypothetical protein